MKISNQDHSPNNSLINNLVSFKAFNLTLALCLMASILFAIRPDVLILSSISLHEKLPLTGYSVNTPLSIFPLALAISLAFHIYQGNWKTLINIKLIPLLFFLIPTLGILTIELGVEYLGNGKGNFRYFFSIFWMLFSSIVSSFIVSIFPKFEELVLRLIFYISLICAVSILTIYFLYPSSVFDSFSIFKDVPKGLIHQQCFYIALGIFAMTYFEIPELKSKMLRLFIYILFFGLILSSFSRGSLLTAILVIIPATLKKKKHLIIATTFLAITTTILSFYSPKVEKYFKSMSLNFSRAISGELETGKDRSANIRLQSNIKAIQSFLSSPIIGVGSENIGRYYSVKLKNKILTHTHWLIILAGYGIFVFLGLILSFFNLAMFSGIFNPSSWAFLFYSFGFLTFMPYFEEWFYLVVLLMTFKVSAHHETTQGKKVFY